MNTLFLSFVCQYILSISQYLVNKKSDDFLTQNNLVNIFRIRVYFELTDCVWQRKHSYNGNNFCNSSAENFFHTCPNESASAHATDCYVLRPPQM